MVIFLKKVCFVTLLLQLKLVFGERIYLDLTNVGCHPCYVQAYYGAAEALNYGTLLPGGHRVFEYETVIGNPDESYSLRSITFFGPENLLTLAQHGWYTVLRDPVSAQYNVDCAPGRAPFIGGGQQTSSTSGLV